MICALILSVATFAKAQEAPATPVAPKAYNPEEAAKKATKQLTGTLKLTDDQKVKVMDLYLAQNNENAKINDDATLDAKGKKSKVSKLKGETDTKIIALLTDEQKTAYQTWKDERKAAKEAAAAKPSM